MQKLCLKEELLPLKDEFMMKAHTGKPQELMAVACLITVV